MIGSPQSQERRLSLAPQTYDPNFSDYAVTLVKTVILLGLPYFSFKFLKKNFNRLVGFEDQFNTAYGTLY